MQGFASRALSLMLAFSPSAAASGFCLPSQPCWPGASAWAELNSSVFGKLLPLNIGENCSGDAFQRAADASCLMYDSTRHASCLLDEPIIFPQYAVHIDKVELVQAAVSFANKYNLRVTVKSTGHSYLGTSNNADGLLIWMAGFNKVDIYESFLDACSNAVSPTVKVQGGATWRDVYPAVPAKYQVVGGGQISVGVAGGYLQGGGHSVLSPSYGLAVDSVLEMEVVTMDGAVHIATACNNTDLFFALRGGGGGTFGIVTSVTLKLHRAPSQIVGLKMLVPMFGLTGQPSDIAKDFLATYIAMQPSLHTCWGGAILTAEIPRVGLSFYLNLICNANLSTAQSSMDRLTKWYDEAKRQHPLTFMFMNFTEYSTCWDWHTHGPVAVGGNVQLASRFIPLENFASDEKASALATTVFKYASMKASFSTNFFIMQLGGAMKTADPQHTSAITDAYRQCQWHAIMSVTYTKDDEANVLQTLAAYQSELASQAPGSGAYINEIMYNEPDWERSIFGSNYPRLLKIKKQFDPMGRLSCHHCVGSSENSTSTLQQAIVI